MALFCFGFSTIGFAADSALPFPKPAFSIDDTNDVSIAASAPVAAVAMNGGAVKILELPSGKVRQTLETDLGSIFTLALSPDGTRLAVSYTSKEGKQGTAVVTLPDGKVRYATTEGYVNKPHWFGNKEKLLLASTSTGSLGALWTVNALNGQVVEDFGHAVPNPTQATASPSGRFLGFGLIQMKDYDNNTEVKDKLPLSPEQRYEAFSSMAFAPDTPYLWVAGRSTLPLIVLDTMNGEPAAFISRMSGLSYYHSLAFTQDAKALFGLDWSGLDVYGVQSHQGLQHWSIDQFPPLEDPQETISSADSMESGHQNWTVIQCSHHPGPTTTSFTKKIALFFSPESLAAVIARADLLQQRSKLFQQWEKVEEATLRDAVKADPNFAHFADPAGNTMMHLAALRNFTGLAEDLRALSVSVLMSNQDSQTALHVAVNSKNKDMTTWLIDHGAKLDPWDKDGFTPLILAIFSEQKEVAQLLLDKGASPDEFESIFTGKVFSEREKKLSTAFNDFTTAHKELADWFVQAIHLKAVKGP